ncbi:MAG: hypothetical protein AAGG38_04855 [Planctomycetota bacterium]
MLLIGFAFLFAVTPAIYANEPGWTDEQRAEKSMAVFTGTVESVEALGEFSEYENLYRATFEVESASKGRHLVGDDKLIVYYILSTTGDAGARCPTYARLESGQRRTVYLRVTMLDGEWHAFIEMGSDVREPSPEGA